MGAAAHLHFLIFPKTREFWALVENRTIITFVFKNIKGLNYTGWNNIFTHCVARKSKKL